MVILSLSLGVLYQAAMGATRNVRVAHEYSEAQLLAESVMSEHTILAAPDQQFSGSWEGYRWQVDMRELPPPGESPSALSQPLIELVVTVAWPGGANDRRWVLSTIVPLPTGAG